MGGLGVWHQPGSLVLFDHPVCITTFAKGNWVMIPYCANNNFYKGRGGLPETLKLISYCGYWVMIPYYANNHIHFIGKGFGGEATRASQIPRPQRWKGLLAKDRIII